MADQDETIFGLMQRRERELTARLAVLRSQIETFEAELAQIQKMRITTATTGLFSEVELQDTGDVSATVSGRVDQVESDKRFSEMTIKELILESLKIIRSGNSHRVREFIREGFHRTIEMDSLRPQLSRLKADEIIAQTPLTEEWYLTEKARPILMFDHPTSRRGMSVLNDEPSAGTIPTKELVRAAKRDLDAPQRAAAKKAVEALQRPKKRPP